MPKRLYHVKLKKTEKKKLKSYVNQGQKSARSITRARILLLADQQKSDEEISKTLGVSLKTIYRIRKGYRQGDLDSILQERSRSGAPIKIDARVEATLTLLACSNPPEGRKRWTLRLLADKLVSLQLIDSISPNTVGKLLKKTNLNLGRKNNGA